MEETGPDDRKGFQTQPAKDYSCRFRQKNESEALCKVFEEV